MLALAPPPLLPEDYLPPKELPDALAGRGLPGWNLRSCRVLVSAMRDSGAPVVRKKYIRASDAAAWLLSHPEWSPYAVNKGGECVAAS
jgi:hypothetical protein